MAHVFISYARKDLKVVKGLRQALREARRQHWLDVENIVLGRKFHEQIEHALRGARAVLVALSPAAAKSPYVTYEWAFALGRGLPVIPVLIRKTDIPDPLRDIQHYDLTSGRKRWGPLVRGLQKSLGAGPTVERRSKARLFATFELADGKPVRIGPEYRIWLGTKSVPPGTRRVQYVIHDDTFQWKKDNDRWTVDAGRLHFQDWMQSYGDVLLEAKGKGDAGPWRAESSLVDALRLGYRGKRVSPPVRKALADIAAN